MHLPLALIVSAFLQPTLGDGIFTTTITITPRNVPTQYTISSGTLAEVKSGGSVKIVTGGGGRPAVGDTSPLTFTVDGDSAEATVGAHGRIVAYNYGTGHIGQGAHGTVFSYGELTASEGATATAVNNGYGTASSNGFVIAQDHGTAFAYYSATVIARSDGTGSAGYLGTGTAYNGGKLWVGHEGTIKSGGQGEFIPSAHGAVSRGATATIWYGATITVAPHSTVLIPTPTPNTIKTLSRLYNGDYVVIAAPPLNPPLPHPT